MAEPAPPAEVSQPAEIKRKPVDPVTVPSNDVNEPQPQDPVPDPAPQSQPQPQSEPQSEPQPQPEQETFTDDKNGAPPASDDTKASRRISRKPVPSAIDIDKSRPEEFEGEVNTNNELPSAKTLKQIEDYIVLDSDGRSHAFKTLYSGSNVARRVLIIFIRHFFCGVGLSLLATLCNR